MGFEDGASITNSMRFENRAWQRRRISIRNFAVAYIAAVSLAFQLIKSAPWQLLSM